MSIASDKIKVITPPNFELIPNDKCWNLSLFLGGSIEMDKAEQWQQRFIDGLRNKMNSKIHGVLKNIYIFNPRRENWDITIKQSITDPVFYQQVNWELDYLEKAEYRVFYFAENTLSPVSLLEYGKFFDYENTYVAAHPNYNRIGNLQIFCHRHGIRLHQSVDDLVTIISPKTYV